MVFMNAKQMILELFLTKDNAGDGEQGRSVLGKGVTRL